MRVTDLTIRNLRILKVADLNDLGSLNVFIGQNASGKSVALWALNNLLEQGIVNLGADDAFRGTPSDLLDFSCSLRMNDEEIDDLVKSTSRANNAQPPEEGVIGEFRQLGDGIMLKYQGIAPVPGGLVQVGKQRLFQAESMGQYLGRVLSAEAQHLGRSNVPYGNVVAGIDWAISKKSLFLPVHRGLPTRFGTGFPQKGRPEDIGPWALKMLAEQRPEFAVLESRMSAPLEHVKGLAVTPGPNDFRLGLVEKGLPGTTPLEGWSSGTSHLAMFFGALTLMPPGSIILAEEPELSLHPGAIRGLMEKMREVADAGQSQIFLTTHSDLVVEQLDIEGKQHTLWRFVRKADGSSSAVKCRTERQIAEARDSLRERPEPTTT